MEFNSQDLTEDQWQELASKVAEGLKGEMNVVDCYDAKLNWKKIEIIYGHKDKDG
tara:strand:+ start:896 stop:1060 length:165 start_codon:yes stop_codon:yes gene_type:complete